MAKLTKEKIRELEKINYEWCVKNHSKFGLTKKEAKIIFKKGETI